MKSNPLLKIMVLTTLLGVAIWAALPGSKSGKSDSNDTVKLDTQLTAEELEALGIEGDTPRDTVATLIGEVKKMRQDMSRLSQQNKALTESNKNLTTDATTIDRKIQSAVGDMRKESEQGKSLINEVLDRFQNQLGVLESRGSGSSQDNEIPVGLGLEGNGLKGSAASRELDELVWQEPLDAVPGKDGKPGSVAFPSSFSSLGQSLSEADSNNPISNSQKTLRANLKGERDIEQAKPVYTIPENSTLIGSIGMTAMIGRVPIGGTVSDPYPFKVLVGHDNLTANGIELPDVASAVMSGTATGDWTLSCVSAEINSITFVFNDGRVRTVPAPQKSADNDNAKKSRLGWLSDPYGIPCISGERKSNANSFIATQVLMGAAAAAAEASAAQQTTVIADSQGSSTAVTGDMGRYIAGKAGAGGLNDVRKWAMERYGQTFDAIYVPPGQQVAIHMSREIPIDYELNGRKVNYELGQSAQLDLD